LGGCAVGVGAAETLRFIDDGVVPVGLVAFFFFLTASPATRIGNRRTGNKETVTSVGNGAKLRDDDDDDDEVVRDIDMDGVSLSWIMVMSSVRDGARADAAIVDGVSPDVTSIISRSHMVAGVAYDGIINPVNTTTPFILRLCTIDVTYIHYTLYSRAGDVA
jgi:hypothetical protein